MLLSDTACALESKTIEPVHLHSMVYHSMMWFIMVCHYVIYSGANTIKETSAHLLCLLAFSAGLLGPAPESFEECQPLTWCATAFSCDLGSN